MNPFELAPAANAHQARLQLGELGPQPVYDWHGKEALSRCKTTPTPSTTSCG